MVDRFALTKFASTAGTLHALLIIECEEKIQFFSGNVAVCSLICKEQGLQNWNVSNLGCGTDN